MVLETRPERFLFTPQRDVVKRRYDYTGPWEEIPIEFGRPASNSAMSVETGPKAERIQARDCYHAKFSTQLYKPSRVYTGFFSVEYDAPLTDWTVSGGSDNFRWITQQMVLPRESPLYTWSPDVDSMIDAFVDRVYQIPSLINFAAEFDDLPRMLRNGQRALRRLQDDANRRAGYPFNRRTSRHIRRTRAAGGDVGDLIDSASGGILTTNMGIIPLLSDIEGFSVPLLSGLAGYRDVRHRMTGDRGLRVARKKRFKYEHSLALDGHSGRYIEVKGEHVRRYVAYARAKFPQGDPFTGLDTWAASGINLDLQTLWNATPFSFLIDYVFPIGDALRSSRIYADVSLHGACMTDHYTGEATFHHPVNSGWGNGVVTEAGRWNFTFDIFSRTAGLWDIPDSISIRDIEPPSWLQALNGAALARSLGRLG